MLTLIALLLTALGLAAARHLTSPVPVDVAASARRILRRPVGILAAAVLGLACTPLLASADDQPRVTTEGVRVMPTDPALLPPDAPRGRAASAEIGPGWEGQVAPAMVRCVRQTRTLSVFAPDPSTGAPAATPATSSSWTSPEWCELPGYPATDPAPGNPPSTWSDPETQLARGYVLEGRLFEEKTCVLGSDGVSVDLCSANWLPRQSIAAERYETRTPCNGARAGWIRFDEARWVTGSPTEAECSDPGVANHEVGYLNPVSRQPVDLRSAGDLGCPSSSTPQPQDPNSATFYCSRHLDEPGGYCPPGAGDPCGTASVAVAPQLGMTYQLIFPSHHFRAVHDGALVYDEQATACASCSPGGAGSDTASGPETSMTVTRDGGRRAASAEAHGRDPDLPAGQWSWSIVDDVAACVDGQSTSPVRPGPRYRDCTAAQPGFGQVSSWSRAAAPVEPPPPTEPPPPPPVESDPQPPALPVSDPDPGVPVIPVGHPSPPPTTQPVAAPTGDRAPSAVVAGGLPMTGRNLSTVALAALMIVGLGAVLTVVGRGTQRGRQR